MTTKGHILVVDDDDLLRESVRARLLEDGYNVSVAANGDAALATAARNPPDLVLLDIGLPDSDGLDVCRALQRDRDVPVIFLTGRSSEIDKVSGLALGDDYVTKPFSLIELEARIAMVLRRIRKVSETPRAGVVEMSGIRLDPVSHEVIVRGRSVDLSPKEFDLLQLLMSRAGEALATNEILSVVWGPEYTGAHELVYVHISWLRQKLCVDPSNPQLIHTVRGVGYRFLPAES
jgi:DNA-binding response OmpR family regulator